MYLATLVCPMSMPSLRSSPWIRGAPHSGLARLMSRISRRISSGTIGLPPRVRDFHRQNKRKPARCQRMTVLRFDDHQGVQNARRNPIEAGKNEAIEVAEGESLRGFSSEHVELVAQRQDLGLERSSWSEE